MARTLNLNFFHKWWTFCVFTYEEHHIVTWNLNTKLSTISLLGVQCMFNPYPFNAPTWVSTITKSAPPKCLAL